MYKRRRNHGTTDQWLNYRRLDFPHFRLDDYIGYDCLLFLQSDEIKVGTQRGYGGITIEAGRFCVIECYLARPTIAIVERTHSHSRKNTMINKKPIDTCVLTTLYWDTLDALNNQSITCSFSTSCDF